ncbi:MAG: glycosyltransferase [Acidilobus sp.]
MDLLAIAITLLTIHVGTALGYYGWARGKAVPYDSAVVQPTYYPFVSVVVPTYMEADRVVTKLNDIAAQRYPGRLEVIVVDDNSPDGTAELAERWRAGDDVKGVSVKVIRRPRREGKSVAENEGAKAAGGDVIVFSDADSLWEPGSLEAAVRALSDPTIGLVTCLKRPMGQTSWRGAESAYRGLNNLLRLAESSSHSTTIAHGEMIAIKKELLGRLGPLRPGADDSDLAHRTAMSGMRAIAIPNAVCLEAVPRGWDAVLWRLRRGQHLVAHFARAMFDAPRAPRGYRGPLAVEAYLHILNPWLAAAGALTLIALALRGSVASIGLLVALGLAVGLYPGARAWAWNQLMLIASQLRNLVTRETVWRKLRK